MGGVGPRRQAREAALQVLYAADATGDLSPGEIKSVFERVVQEFSLPGRARERALVLCGGVAEQLARIDEAVGRASTHWKVNRLATVERNLLRLSVFELICEAEIPPEVVIDEAVEIARRFGGEGAPSFVNGVLDMLVRESSGGAA